MKMHKMEDDDTCKTMDETPLQQALDKDFTQLVNIAKAKSVWSIDTPHTKEYHNIQMH